MHIYIYMYGVAANSMFFDRDFWVPVCRNLSKTCDALVQDSSLHPVSA